MKDVKGLFIVFFLFCCFCCVVCSDENTSCCKIASIQCLNGDSPICCTNGAWECPSSTHSSCTPCAQEPITVQKKQDDPLTSQCPDGHNINENWKTENECNFCTCLPDLSISCSRLECANFNSSRGTNSLPLCSDQGRTIGEVWTFDACNLCTCNSNNRVLCTARTGCPTGCGSRSEGQSWTVGCLNCTCNNGQPSCSQASCVRRCCDPTNIPSCFYGASCCAESGRWVCNGANGVTGCNQPARVDCDATRCASCSGSNSNDNTFCSITERSNASMCICKPGRQDLPGCNTQFSYDNCPPNAGYLGIPKAFCNNEVRAACGLGSYGLFCENNITGSSASTLFILEGEVDLLKLKIAMSPKIRTDISLMELVVGNFTKNKERAPKVVYTLTIYRDRSIDPTAVMQEVEKLKKDASFWKSQGLVIYLQDDPSKPKKPVGYTGFPYGVVILAVLFCCCILALCIAIPVCCFLDGRKDQSAINRRRAATERNETGEEPLL